MQLFDSKVSNHITLVLWGSSSACSKKIAKNNVEPGGIGNIIDRSNICYTAHVYFIGAFIKKQTVDPE
jgi:lipoprotein signal peptidase